jgi:hypothetical protein
MRRENLPLSAAGSATEIKPLFVDRAATKEDQSLETEMFEFS